MDVEVYIFRTPYAASEVAVFGTGTEVDGMYTRTGRFTSSKSWQTGISVAYEHCDNPGFVIWKLSDEYGEYKWVLTSDMNADNELLEHSTPLFEAPGREHIDCPPCGDCTFYIHPKWRLLAPPCEKAFRVICMDEDAEYPSEEEDVYECGYEYEDFSDEEYECEYEYEDFSEYE